MTTTGFPARVQRRDPGSWLARAARFGMLARGLLLLVVGGLAVAVAFGAGGKPEDSEGAMHEIAATGWGAAVLVVLAIGLAGYALWRFAVAAVGEKLESGEDVGLGKRLWYVARGAVYAFLSYSAVSLLVGSGGGGGASERKSTAVVLSWPAGRWLVGAAGVAIAAWGAWSAFQAVTTRFKKDLKTERMSAGEERWVTRAGVVGFLSRAVVFGLVGAFLVKAAAEYDPDEAVGLDGALQRLAQQPYGQALLGLVAVGIVAYGLFYFARARYREV